MRPKPDGTYALPNPYHSNIWPREVASMAGFPVPNGIISLVLYLKKSGNEQSWEYFMNNPQKFEEFFKFQFPEVAPWVDTKHYLLNN